jgi:hypothetical protein
MSTMTVFSLVSATSESMFLLIVYRSIVGMAVRASVPPRKHWGAPLTTVCT